VNDEARPRGDESEFMPPPKQQSQLSAALAKAQAAFSQIHRDKTVKVRMKSGGEYSFSYAPLESILRAVMPALSANGLSLTQSTGTVGEKEFVRTQLRHASGECIENNTKVLVADSGPQAYGSALTYARRYGITLLLCICADDDDDGNAAEGNEAQENLAAKKLAADFQAALKTGIDGRMQDVHQKANGDQELYQIAWKLLTAPERREIKAALERVKTPNTNRPERANA
jgi:hypothetical protein